MSREASLWFLAAQTMASKLAHQLSTIGTLMRGFPVCIALITAYFKDSDLIGCWTISTNKKVVEKATKEIKTEATM